MYATGFAFTHSKFVEPANDAHSDIAENIRIIVSTYCREGVAPELRAAAIEEVRALRRAFN